MENFPDVYLEFPLAGTPFLDATILYGRKVQRMPVITSSAADGTQEMLRWFFSVSEEYTDICCGYELDTKTEKLPAAGVHFQPRKHLELVEPFCVSLGEAWRAPLYLAAAVCRRLSAQAADRKEGLPSFPGTAGTLCAGTV